MKEITFDIDGREIRAREGMTILEAAKDAGIPIPTLCHHEELAPYGACRICSVEIETGGGTRLVAACVYPVEENLKVKTKSDRVVKVRKMLLELLLARAPGAEILQDLGREYKVGKIRFEKESSFCILCGLCVRYCSEIKKKNAIGFIERGTEREVMFIPEVASRECPSCKECFPLCPTNVLQANFLLAQALFFPSSSSKSKGTE